MIDISSTRRRRRRKLVLAFFSPGERISITSAAVGCRSRRAASGAGRHRAHGSSCPGQARLPDHRPRPARRASGPSDSASLSSALVFTAGGLDHVQHSLPHLVVVVEPKPFTPFAQLLDLDGSGSRTNIAVDARISGWRHASTRAPPRLRVLLAILAFLARIFSAVRSQRRGT